MRTSIETRFGTVRIGTQIRISRVFCTVNPSRAFPDGIDHQAQEMNGKEGTVETIDDADCLRGTWGGLGILPEVDTFEILEY